MNAQVALKQYGSIKVNAAVESASPHQLIQMLYDGLLERVAQMRGAIEQSDIEQKNIRVNQAVSILSGLRQSLDSDKEQDISATLDSLYDYVQRRLWHAHMHNDAAALDECTNIITDMSTAWAEIA